LEPAALTAGVEFRPAEAPRLNPSPFSADGESGMTNDYFASSTISLVLSWIFSVPVLLGIVAFIFSIFRKHKDVPWSFSVWLGLCFLILSPVRYALFQVVMAESYLFQSTTAFLVSLATLAIFLVPLAFGLLYTVGIGIPFVCVFWLLGRKSPPSKLRYVSVALAAPIIFLLGEILSSFVLPFAAISTHALRAEDVIRASNGPAYYLFACLTPRGMVALPPYISKTPQTTRDYLRSHVALMYLTNREHVYFLGKAYPELKDELSETIMNL
jgi:hypothetical protein